MANNVHEKLGLPVNYVVSNPSSYAYLDASRPPAPEAAAACDAYDNWPYGLKALKGYAAQLSGEQLIKQYVSRPVMYLLGELDTLPLAGFDSSCPAMAQGPSRLPRGQTYADHVH